MDGAENLDTFRQELKHQLRDEVRKELRNELMDEVEDVEYDEVPLEGEYVCNPCNIIICCLFQMHEFIIVLRFSSRFCTFILCAFG